MKINVRLYTMLEKYGKEKIDKDNNVDIPEKSSLNDLVLYLDIPIKLGKIFLVNGLPRTIEHKLNEGDKVEIYSAMCGG
jgi:sulfur carrier protein ThiS